MATRSCGSTAPHTTHHVGRELWGEPGHGGFVEDVWCTGFRPAEIPPEDPDPMPVDPELPTERGYYLVILSNPNTLVWRDSLGHWFFPGSRQLSSDEVAAMRELVRLVPETVPADQEELSRLRALVQAIGECHDDPASAIVHADIVAGEAILRASAAEARVAKATERAVRATVARFSPYLSPPPNEREIQDILEDVVGSGA